MNNSNRPSLRSAHGKFLPFIVLALSAVLSASAAPVYLNNANISVAVGAGTSPGSFNNTYLNGSNVHTIDKVIDAPSATATEFHDQDTHIWFTAAALGGGLELFFNFGLEYDITTLHFWNYTAESYDVDNIAFTFFNSANTEVGAVSLSPDLGSSPGILAQDIVLAAPLNVQYVKAFLTGSNQQVDFQNIGFTAGVSAPPTHSVPEAGSTVVLLGLGVLLLCRFRKL